MAAGLARYRTTFCNCGCRAVRLHAETESGQPIVTIQFTAEQALALARDLVEDAEHAVPRISKAEALAAH